MKSRFKPLPDFVAALALFVLISVDPVAHGVELSPGAKGLDAVELAWPPIIGPVPPPGIEVDSSRLAQLTTRIAELRTRLSAHHANALFCDVEVLLKAVEFAIDHGEFYDIMQLAVADETLNLASSRLDELDEGRPAWIRATGLVVRGFRSQIDGSVQPYGLVIPEGLDLDRPAPLYVWLHGRGDKSTDLHFIHERRNRLGEVHPPGAIVLHPFGRQCLGYKSAGERDVFEAISAAKSHYAIDSDRVVLMGFSMGGAGAWHLGAHYADQWVAASPGAGFAETAKYNRLQPADYPPEYEQLLWGVYDVPAYAANLFNLPVVAYSGEKDPQIQAARVMESAFARDGKSLTHLIGPGMGHRYDRDVLDEILRRMDSAVQQGRDREPSEVFLQTRTLRYNRMHWLEVLRLQRHWHDTRVSGRRISATEIELTTENVRTLSLSLSNPPERIVVDNQPLTVTPDLGNETIWLSRRDERWQVVPRPDAEQLEKKPGLQGPIDDAFLEPFLVVLPSENAKPAAVQQWLDFEIDHLARRWSRLFRGRLRIKQDADVTSDDLQRYHLLLWGTPESNSMLSAIADRLPIHWDAHSVGVDRRRFEAEHHVPILVYPNPLNPKRYVVVNSGPTFREGHDRTNSLQNPKLPDWAILDLRQPPGALSAGRVVAANFFDESWQPKP